MSARFAMVGTVVLALGLASCVSAPGPRRPPPSRAPHSVVQQPVRGTDPARLRQCIGDLDALVARYALLPDRDFGGGCSALGAVQLRDIGTPTTNLGAMTCDLARTFTLWVQRDLTGPAKRYFGSPVVRIESMGSYACRGIIGSSSASGLSEHAYANAVDIAAFVLADGRRITVQDGWNGRDDERAFLRAVHDAGCARFRTVLSPDYNAAHHDHLHFDMGRGPFCR